MTSPTTRQLLAGVREALQTMASELSGRHRFELRLALKALEIIDRELDQGATYYEAEAAALRQFLGVEASVQELRQNLCDQLSSGELDPQEAGMLELLRAQVQARLALDNPNFDQGEQASE